MAKLKLILPLPPGDTAMVTDRSTDSKHDELFLDSEAVDIAEKTETTFLYQSEAAQSATAHDEERMVISGLLMNNINPEERIVIVGNLVLDNKEIAEEEEEQEVAKTNSFIAEQMATIEELAAPQDCIDTTPPTVWVFTTETEP